MVHVDLAIRTYDDPRERQRSLLDQNSEKANWKSKAGTLTCISITNFCVTKEIRDKPDAMGDAFRTRESKAKYPEPIVF